MPTNGQILYNEDGSVVSNPQFILDTVSIKHDSVLNANNIIVNQQLTVSQNIGVATASPRQAVDIIGGTIITAQGSDSEANQIFGLNGSYETLSLTSPNMAGRGGRVSLFFGLNNLYSFPIARIVGADETGRTSLAFQTGRGPRLVERMRIDTNGYIGIGTSTPNYMLDVDGMAHIKNNVFLNGQSILYKNYTIPTPASGTLFLNFLNVGSTSTTIDIELSMFNTTSPNDSTMSKFTAFLSGYKGTGTGLYMNNISVQKNGTAFFGPYNINTNTNDPSGLSIQIDYINSPTTAAVNYTAYGSGAYKITLIDISPTARVAGASAGVASDPPTNVNATASPGQASVSWSAPSNNGGSDILGYVVSWNGGSKNATSTSTTITGLNNGTTYTFTVIAVNTIGNSSGANSNSVTPKTIPDPPTGVNATAGNGSATINWSPPGNNGGSAIIDYYISYSGGNQSTSGTSITINGLPNGSPYSFTVFARNQIGNSSGVTSNTVTPLTPVSPPGPPQNVNATGGDGTANITWSAPSSNGGAAIDYYTVNGSNVGNVNSYNATGLSNGTSYTFSIAAHNSAGLGSSSNSNSVTPVTSIPSTFSVSPSHNYQNADPNTGYRGTYYYGDNLTLPSIRGVSYFKVYVITQLYADNEVAVNNNSVPSNTNYSINLQPGSVSITGDMNSGLNTYSYTIYAYDSNNNKVSQSSTFDVQIGDDTTNYGV